MGEAWGQSIGLCTIQNILVPRGVWSEAAYCLRLSAHTPRTPEPVFRPLSGGCSPAGVWGGQPDSWLCVRCPLAVWEKCLPSSAAVGMEGAGGRGVMLGLTGASWPRSHSTSLQRGAFPGCTLGAWKTLIRHSYAWGGRREQLVVPLYFYPAFVVDMATIAENNYCVVTTWEQCWALPAAAAAGYCAQTNQGASDPSRNSERLGGPGSSSGALCSPVACPATLGRAPGTGNPACGCCGARPLQAPSYTEVGRQEHALVAG